jgi:hypothetical protein
MKKEQEEADFTRLLDKNKKLRKKYDEILPQMKTIYGQLDPIAKNRFILVEVLGGSNIEIFLLTSYADRLVKAFQENGEDGYQRMASRVLQTFDKFYKDYSATIDQEVLAALTAHLATSLDKTYLPETIAEMNDDDFNAFANQIFTHSILPTQASYSYAIQQGGESFTKAMEADSAYQTYLSWKRILDEQLSPEYNSMNVQLQDLQQTYVTALMEAYPDRRFWPDANSTLRVSYGQVEPYEPRDGISYKTKTYLEGIIEKYVPGDYEFDVHPRMIELYKAKDYGNYAENGKLPVCFIASNHTTGGNSGSPAIDAYGNLLGINFDRVWEGTMSDLHYDRSICRNIMVDVRYILFVFDKFAGASHLINDKKLVHPKT